MNGLIWLAVSSKQQTDNVSLGEQLRQGLYHAERHNVPIIGALVVPGESRSITLFDRAAAKVRGFYLTPEAIKTGQSVGVERYIKQEPSPVGVVPVMVYAKFLELAEDNKFQVFFFLNRNRLGRKASLSMSVVGICEDNDIRLFDMESPPISLARSTNRDERFIGAFKSVEGENQIIKLQEDHRTGMIRRVEHGKMPSNINFGYAPIYERGKLTGYSVVEKAAETVIALLNAYLNGDGMKNIAATLNRENMKAPNGEIWYKESVKNIIVNVWRYAGFVELNVRSKTGRPYIRTRGMWPAIITEETARRVIAEREARNPTRRSVNATYRFTRMCRCYVCGGRMHSQIKRSEWKRLDGTIGSCEDVFYRCPTKGHVMISEKKITRAIEGFVRTIIESPEAAAAWTERPVPDQSTTIMASIDRLNAHIDKLTTGISKADIDFYSGGALSEDGPRHQAIVGALKKQITAAQGELTTLQNKLHEEERSNQRSARIDDLRANGLFYLGSADIRTANSWLRDRFIIVIDSGPKYGGRVREVRPLF